MFWSMSKKHSKPLSAEDITDIQAIKTRKHEDTVPFDKVFRTCESLASSRVLDQLVEEWNELHDPVTAKLVSNDRKGKTKPVPFGDFAKE